MEQGLCAVEAASEWCAVLNGARADSAIHFSNGDGDGVAACTQSLGALTGVRWTLEGTLLCATAEGLLYSLAKLLGEDSVEEGVTAGVDWEYQHHKPLRRGGVDQIQAKDGRQSEEAQRGPTQEIHHSEEEDTPDQLPVLGGAVCC